MPDFRNQLEVVAEMPLGSERRQAAMLAASHVPWAMLPETIEPTVERLAELQYETPDLRATLVDSHEPQAAMDGIDRVAGSVAVVPISGMIDQKPGFWTDTSTDQLQAILSDLAANPNVGAIVLDVDSPGGIVFGTPETSEVIRGLRKTKAIYGIANSMAASAAYYLASAATKLFITPSGQVGSIGVWSMHIDISKALDEVGFKVTLIAAGKYKVEGNPFEPLGDEARKAWQSDVSAYYDQFVEDVARNRGRRASTVRGGFGEGRMVLAAPAAEEGMADGIATLPQLLGALVPRRRTRQNTALAALRIEEAE